MGWASGNDVFDPVARELQNRVDDPQARTAIATVLIDALQGRGWDTEGESLEEFHNDPAIVAAFAANGVTTYDDEDDD